jgi:23S rRNA pseudouridine2605 synthase
MEKPAQVWLLLVLKQGRKREIRRMMAAIGREVRVLRRIRIGPLRLDTLGSGAFREITDDEVLALYAAGKRVGAPPPLSRAERRAGENEHSARPS